ncbi:DUF6920 family protein [Flavivirga rizhaonensis]|uniref:Uncharacterized protein n=1 Tax=Flavivirga rizhaonensis TaxID=2559571 RepID=A0A4S1E1B0_9FLAO|nr:DUF6544 family protein [Flavivirga rizhaonensis]TGV04357.1 hypothetical protein EM932_02220 [Flavivirga rizhaonensis]
MRLAFLILLLIHGTIHLVGFVIAFYSTKIPMQALGISKPIGTLWLIAFVMFVVTASQFFTNKKWFYIAFIAVCISQILIIMVWKDAKYGTIANTIILLVNISAFENFRFNKMVQKESATLFDKIEINTASVILEKDIQHLPEIVQKWMKNSGVIDKNNIASVRLKQKGLLKIKPNGKWMPFRAKQYFNLNTPAFIWSAKINNNSTVYALGRDKFNNGKAEMLIKFLGVIPVVDEVENYKIDSGTMQRFLSEMCWFPSAAINNYLQWEHVNNTSAKATFMYKAQSVSAIFKFNNEGEIICFETSRFFGGEPDSKKEKWVVDIVDYKTFNNYKIPYKCKVTWQLKDGNFNWLNLEITDIEYNISEPYK